MRLSITPGNNNVGAYINNVDINNIDKVTANQIAMFFDKLRTGKRRRDGSIKPLSSSTLTKLALNLKIHRCALEQTKFDLIERSSA